jgi:hypothetical protein
MATAVSALTTVYRVSYSDGYEHSWRDFPTWEEAVAAYENSENSFWMDLNGSSRKPFLELSEVKVLFQY